MNLVSDFYTKRKIGQNDTEICELIRNDKIEEFIIYVKRNDYQLKTKVDISTFETNSLFFKRVPSLIEYTAFFGSIQIFKYLYLNDVKLSPSLWIYGIHGDCPELFNILEENHILPEDKSYTECFLESIKCHNNNIANYILSNYIDENQMGSEELSEFKKKVLLASFQYHNYFYIPNNVNENIIFFYACKYDHFKIVEYLVKTKHVDINIKEISNSTIKNKIHDIYFYIT